MKEHVLNQKKAVVDEIKGHINDAKSMVIVDYRGLDVSEATELREKFRNENVLFKVYKNTMMNFAFKELGFDGFLDYLSGPNAVAFSMDDPIAAARIAKQFAADHENLEIKAGYLGDKFLDVEGVKKIASIPSREVLLTKMLGSFKAPVSKFVYLADAIAKSKKEGSEEAESNETTEIVEE
ncbi:MAG: 50S ribosomal protein L10 [Finegoldia magna]|jgi:ribosomal protein L10|uniref:Large ribosomal subunit protein uL10 n=1 Tax=Finegoldia magna TaxID=1260 RepID=A0A2N6SR20_FINMA|nr:50S ribosomal protein L10 [Finegoldia magna]MDU2639242.1 50S ribosomal protein L10 [Finegoldia magna]MDU5508234.1 50S ribosomal protein L10 [Finegoldia magna]PMC59514.1 50S ribosomal protein L10 [Finegoldia magna]